MGQERDGAADRLQDGDEVRRGDCLQMWGPASACPATRGDPAAVSDGARWTCRLLPRPHQRIRSAGGGLRHVSYSDTTGGCAGWPPTTSGCTGGAPRATRNWCASSRVLRGISALAGAPGRRGAGWFLALVWWERRSSKMHPRGSALGLPLRRQLRCRKRGQKHNEFCGLICAAYSLPAALCRRRCHTCFRTPE